MTEIEKLMENAGIEPDCSYLFLVDGNGQNEAARTMSIGSKKDLKRLIVDCGVKGRVIRSTNTLKPFYPPFTAEKQLELIKFLLDKYCDIRIRKNLEGAYYITSFNDISCFSEDFEETLASFTNTHLQDLTESEKEEIRGILQ